MRSVLLILLLVALVAPIRSTFGDCLKSDPSKSGSIIQTQYEDLKAEALLGNAEDQLDAFLFVYQNASHFHDKLSEAFDFLVKSAEQGNIDGQYNLGYMLQTGTWIDKNEETALPWLLQAAERGHVRAQLWCGINFVNRFHESSNDADKDAYALNATHWLKRASDSGIEQAKVLLATILINDEASREEGLNILKEAAAGGDKSAKEALDSMQELLDSETKE